MARQVPDGQRGGPGRLRHSRRDQGRTAAVEPGDEKNACHGYLRLPLLRFRRMTRMLGDATAPGRASTSYSNTNEIIYSEGPVTPLTKCGSRRIGTLAAPVGCRRAAWRNPVWVRGGPATVTGERFSTDGHCRVPGGKAGGAPRSGSQETSVAPGTPPAPPPLRPGARTPPGGTAMPSSFVLLSTADTDLLAARASGAPWRGANPTRLDPVDLPALLADAGLVGVRPLGGP